MEKAAATEALARAPSRIMIVKRERFIGQHAERLLCSTFSRTSLDPGRLEAVRRGRIGRFRACQFLL